MHRIAVAAVAAALSITGLFASPVLATTTTSHEWQIQAGTVPRFDAAGPSGAGNRFYPNAITIHQGDSIKFAPFGAHTITYNRPPGPVFALFAPSGGTTLADPAASLNSGFVAGPPDTFTVTFASTLPPGRYKFICGLHVGMSETVDVRALGATLPKGDLDYAAIAQAQMTRDLASVDRIAANATENLEDKDGNPTVLVGAGNKRVSNIRFFPASINIRVGQTITFLKTHDPTEPHTVTFGPEPSDQLQQLLPRGGSTYAGGVTEQASSGLLTTRQQFDYFQLAPLAGLGLPVALTEYRLTFTKAGDYKYICAIHDIVGMVAWVHVR